jgi:hypothetical protein
MVTEQQGDTWEVIVLGDSGWSYTVKHGPQERYHGGVDWSCTREDGEPCPAFRFGKGKPCKHIRRAMLAMERKARMSETKAEPAAEEPIVPENVDPQTGEIEEPEGDLTEIDPRFIIDMRGKLYPTWPGVLDAAHRKGLTRLSATLIQAPMPENGHNAICAARAEFADGQVFEEIGDASPGNVGTHLVASIIRFAATRAKGRALRDALNVGVTLLEELPPEGAQSPPGQRAAGRGPSAGSGPSAAPAQPAGAGRLPTESSGDQRSMLIHRYGEEKARAKRLRPEEAVAGLKETMDTKEVAKMLQELVKKNNDSEKAAT